MATREQIEAVIKTILDPDIHIDIWTLGLIYDIRIDGEIVDIQMTFTTPACPAGPQLVGEVKEKIEGLEGVKETRVEVVFNPPWQPSEELKMMMGIY